MLRSDLCSREKTCSRQMVNVTVNRECPRGNPSVHRAQRYSMLVSQLASSNWLDGVCTWPASENQTTGKVGCNL